MITGINYLRIFSVMIPDWETNFKDVQANDFGNLGKRNSRNVLVGNHAVIFTEITLWHEIITKIIPWELFFVILRRFRTLKIFGKEGLFQGSTREIRNFPKIIILK